jgi:hypothetical protein
MNEYPTADHEPQAAGPATVPSPGRYGRRALLFGAAATGAGVAVSLAGGTAPAEAASRNNGGPVLLGETNTATAATTITNADGGAFSGNTSANGGHSGVHGNDTSSEGGYGVAGSSTNGYGVAGNSTSGTGVGVQGTTTAPGGIGVAGIDNSGEDLSIGVSGTSTIGFGVSGNCPNGVAIYGESANGYAVYATSAGGTGLLVQGPSVFQGATQFKNSGFATVKKGDKSVKVKLAGVTVESIVLATLHALQPGIAVAAAVPEAGSFTITLTGTVPADTAVGWFVIG